MNKTIAFAGAAAALLPEDEEREEQPLTWTADDMAARAFRAALFGYFTCGVLHVYALWLLLRLPSAEGELSPAGTRKAYAAAALALPPVLVVVLFTLWQALSALWEAGR